MKGVLGEAGEGLLGSQVAERVGEESSGAKALVICVRLTRGLKPAPPENRFFPQSVKPYPAEKCKFSHRY